MMVGWPLQKLEDLTEPDRPITYGVVKPGAEDPENGVKFVRGGDIFEGRLAIENLRTITPTVSRSYSRTLLAGGELVVSLVGNPGHVAVVPNSLAGANLARQAGLVALRNDIDANFVKFFLMSPQGRAELFAQMTGSVQIVINLHNLRTVRVPVPPLPIQRCIAGILSAYDELIENNQRRIKILESMARALYREWFVHFRFPGHEAVPRVPSPLGEIPEGWEFGRLDDVVVLQRGFDLPKANRVLGTVPIYAATGVNGFHNEARVKAPGVITGRSGTIGHVEYVQEDYWPLNTTLWAREFPRSEPIYAYYVISSLDLRQFNSGAAVPTLNRNDIHSLNSLIPPRGLQAKFQDVAGAMLAHSRTLGHTNDNLRRTRDLLLPRLLSGQINVEAA